MADKPKRPRGKVSNAHAKENRRITNEGIAPSNWRYCTECSFYYPPDQQNEHEGHGTGREGW